MKKVLSVAAIMLALAALVAAYGCGSPGDPTAVRAQGASYQAAAFGAAASNAPVLVSCGPGQRVLIRSADPSRGAATEVECVASAAPAYGWPNTQPVWSGAQAMPVANYPPVVTERRVVYERAPERTRSSGRTWQKSALIIGSSAGIGAGVGAAVGGKKGALIGAAIGGGGATIWDQTTRR